jgi:hypothetical protein
MEKQNFETKLKNMTKPEIHELKHQDMLAEAIINAEDKSVVSAWWLAIPVFVILMLIMKSTFMPGTTLSSNLHELEDKNRNISTFFFLISPLIIIIFNSFTIRKIYLLSGSPKSLGFLRSVWSNVLIIAFCLALIIIYSL